MIISFVFLVVVVILWGLWKTLRENSYCKNSDYDNAILRARAFKIIEISRRDTTGPTGFELHNGKDSVLNFVELGTPGISGGLIWRIQYCGLAYGFRLHYARHYVQIFKNSQKFGQIDTRIRPNRTINVNMDITAAHSRPKSSDIELRQGTQLLATLTYESSIKALRKRAVFFYNPVDIDAEVAILMLGIFCEPKYGHDYND